MHLNDLQFFFHTNTIRFGRGISNENIKEHSEQILHVVYCFFLLLL